MPGAQHALQPVECSALAAFDGLVRRCFAGFTGIHPTADQWQQAALGFAQAGLGLRCTAAHAPAAYPASSLSACPELDASFCAEAVTAHVDVAAALAALNAQLPGVRALSLDAALGSKQRQLSERLDAAGWDACLLAASPTARAILFSEAGAGARAFLAAWQNHQPFLELNCAFEWAFLKLLWCPRCDGVLDCQGHHSAVCVAGGERRQRHNAVRDLVHSWAERAGLRPEKERPGLLLPQSPDDVQAARRRPADVYLPALGGSPAALDFAVTAPQRQETLSIAGRATGAAAASYARHKEAHLDTAKCCESQGIVFVPMVVETTGTWDKGAAVVLNHIARAVAARTGEDAGAAQTALMQELSVVVRTWRARAALRRRCEATE